MASNPLLDPDARLVIAHRGNRVAAPENTIPALRQALDMGVDALEFDVRMTRDDVAVVIHDATVDRTTNGAGRVDAYDLASLRALDAGARCVGAARTHIPTLEEVFDAFRDTPLVIEIKELAALDATLALIRRFGVEHRVVVGSAENAVMERLYRSGLPCCASMADAMAWLPLALLGRRPPRPPFHVLSITPFWRGLPIPVVRLARAGRAHSVPTHVWTVNDPTRALRYWNSGIAGILTDDPARMLAARER